MSGSAEAITIRAATAADAPSIAAIYNHYIAQTVITFEEAPVSAAEIGGRIHDVQAASLPWLIAEGEGRVLGYAYGAQWRTRSAYRFSVEISAYIRPDSARRGLGSRLYAELFPRLERRQIRAVMAAIALPNQPSVALHEKFLMQKVAHFAKVGFKFGRWLDVGYWQRTL